MKRRIIQTKAFAKSIRKYFASNMLDPEDYKDFEQHLLKYPEIGDLIPGTSGTRKIRLKSTSRGASGGFRICYFYDQNHAELFLILIYAKNKQENITPEQKNLLKKMAKLIKS